MIDYEALREELKQELYGAAFGGGFSGAFLEAGDVDDASPEELLRMARNNGIDPEDYERLRTVCNV